MMEALMDDHQRFSRKGRLMKKNIWAAMLALVLLFSVSLGEETGEDPLSRFSVRNGSRQSPQIAITVDDAFDLDYVWQIRDLFHEYGQVCTFFPIGVMLKEENRDDWQKVLDYGDEIGSHNWGHYRMGDSQYWAIVSALGRFQARLDAILGYHYQIHAFRPPFGNYTSSSGRTDQMVNAVRALGYNHVILWDVSQTDPEKALKAVRNGSILLYHARHKDYECLRVLLPQLLEAGYQPVTVSQLLGLGPNEISDEPYVYSKEDFQPHASD